jgi:hypothetical protein
MDKLGSNGVDDVLFRLAKRGFMRHYLMHENNDKILWKDDNAVSHDTKLIDVVRRTSHVVDVGHEGLARAL